MIRKSEYPGVPNAIVKHYQKLKVGYKYERNGVIFTEKHWSYTDEERMLRLLTWPKISETWHRVTLILSREEDQIKLFDASWRAYVNYDEYRFKTSGKGARRKNEAEKLVSGIKKHAEQLSSLLNQLSDLGYRSQRNPDLSLNQTSLQTELAWLIDKVNCFDPHKITDEQFINNGISSQENNFRRECLRGFVSLLHSAGLSPDPSKDWSNIVLGMTNATLGLMDDGVTYNDAYKVLLEFKEKSNL
ncbi:hypothetical protein [Methylobacter luteus]|uniref:hypothetical protein n=1 Tax=Methylobacter luteus TaxID=415 RepID=UPI00040685C8|nr:hypothetical protein [Methylobacter luteus]